MKRKSIFKAIVALAVAMAFVMPVAAVANVRTIGVTSNSKNSAEEIVDENEVPSLEYAPSTIMPNDAQYNGAFTFGDKMFYGYCLLTSPLPKGPIKIPSDNPGSSESIASSSVTVYAATWALDEWYAIDDGTKAFITIDNKTGDMTIIGSTGITSSYITTGLTYDPSSETMYASAGVTIGVDLYTHFYSVDMDTGVATHLSQVSSPCAIIAIGCDNDGNIYGPDIYDENLYLIDPVTATLTLIGNTGLSLNYAQGAAYDKNEDILYLAAYTGAGGLYTCDTTTGHAALIGNFPGGEEIAGLAIPYTLSQPPEKPQRPEGPTHGKPGVEYNYTTTTTDPDGDQVYYKWSWGDGTYSGWLGPYNSGTTATGSHSWSVLGTYDIKVKAKDIHGAQSDWSDALTISIVENEPPNKPTITGQIQGKPGVKYLYTFVTTDPDDDDVYYYVDWGDGNNSGWKGPYDSGEDASATHSWSSPGTYTIKVKAKDTLDDESEWGTLDVTMPVNYQRSQQSSTPLFFQILQRLLTTR